MSTTVREAVGVFDDAETLQAAIDELLSSGFNRVDLSLLAGHQAVEEKLGHIYEKVEDLEDDPQSSRAAYMAPETIGDAEGALIGAPLYVAAATAIGLVVATGGTVAAAAGAAALAGGAGAAIGTVLSAMLEKHHADYLNEQLEKGGLLLWAHTRDAAHEEKAQKILSTHSAHDVHLHDLPQAA